MRRLWRYDVFRPLQRKRDVHAVQCSHAVDDGCIWLSVDRQRSSKVPAVEAGGEAIYVYEGGGVFGTPKGPIAPAKEQRWGQMSLSAALPEVRRTRSQRGSVPPQSAIKKAKKPVKQRTNSFSLDGVTDHLHW